MIIKIKIKINKWRVFTLLLLTSCATATIPLRLQDRTLLLDPLSPSLLYPYKGKDCKYPERRIFKGCKLARIIKRYDLKDEVVRKQLIAAGFTCKSNARFKYD